MNVILSFSAQCYTVVRMSQTHTNKNGFIRLEKQLPQTYYASGQTFKIKRIKRRTSLTIEFFVWKMHKITL